MALISLYKKIDQDGEYVEKYNGSLRYIAMSDDIDSNFEDILSDTLTPKVGDRLFPGSSSVISGVSASRDDNSKTKWNVDVQYKANTSTAPGGQEGIDGEDMNITEFSTRLAAYSVVAGTCYFKGFVQNPYPDDGVFTGEGFESSTFRKLPILTSAGDRFETPPTEMRYNLVISWKQKESTYFEELLAWKYINTINSKGIVICGLPIKAKTGLLKNIQPIYQPTGRFQTLYEVEINPRAWYNVIQDMGFRAKFSGGKRPIVNEDVISPADLTAGTEKDNIADAAHLDGKGGVNSDQTGASVWYAISRTKPQVDWNVVLNLAKKR